MIWHIMLSHNHKYQTLKKRAAIDALVNLGPE